jgi:hypothetical protein
MENAKVCENCKFWNETGASDAGLVGDCRRNSPSPITLNGRSEASVRMAAWPATAQDQWCGDFEERPMETKEVLERMAMIEKMEADRKTKKATT